MKYLFLLLTGFITSHLYAQTAWKIQSSKVNFSVKNAGLTVKGSVDGFKADIQFDPKAYTQANMKGSVNVNTLQTGIKLRDEHLQKQEYFNQAQFPVITLQSSFFGKTDNGYKGYFKLTIKGVTKDVIIPFTWSEQGETAVVKGIFTINRLDFGIGEESLMLSNDIQITIELNLKHP